MAGDGLLELDGVTVSFRTEDGDVQAVRGIDLTVAPGEILALVGESGSGKSVTMGSVLGLHPTGRTTVSGQVRWQGEDLLAASPERLRQVRGNEIAMVFQDPLTALNPVLSVGRQIAEAVRAHRNVSKQVAWDRAVEMLELVGIPSAERRAAGFPHEMSGGMRQRAMIAMALSCDPSLVIADEPTTALDVTVQAQVLEVLVERVRGAGAAMVLVTHDLGVVAGVADRVAVMYAGRVVELATTEDLFANPSHPYTLGLLASLPNVDADPSHDLDPIPGQPPSMLNPPAGCAFHPRCSIPDADAGCTDRLPELTGPDGHQVACWRPDQAVELRARGAR